MHGCTFSIVVTDDLVLKAPGHQYQQFWLNIHNIGPISYRNIGYKHRYYTIKLHFENKLSCCLEAKSLWNAVSRGHCSLITNQDIKLIASNFKDAISLVFQFQPNHHPNNLSFEGIETWEIIKRSRYCLLITGCINPWTNGTFFNLDIRSLGCSN